METSNITTRVATCCAFCTVSDFSACAFLAFCTVSDFSACAFLTFCTFLASCDGDDDGDDDGDGDGDWCLYGHCMQPVVDEADFV